MVSRCGYPVQEEDPTPTQPLLLPVILSFDDLCYPSVLMIILWSLGVGILYKKKTPPNLFSFLYPCLWMTFVIPLY